MDVPYQPHAPPISLRPRLSLRPSVVPEYLPVPHRLRFKPRLRPRLTLGGLPFPRKPQASGGKVSHLTLVTHAGILSTVQSSLASAWPSTRTVRSPTPPPYAVAPASVACFSPVHFRRRTSRPVSCYALFKCMAASKPTSWLSPKSHFLPHLTCPSGP